MQTYNLDDVKRIDALLSKPLDVEEEMYRASQHKYFNTKEGIQKLLVPSAAGLGPGSFLTGTSAELIYSNGTAGAAINFGSTGEVVLNTVAGMGPQPIIPPYFFLPGGNNIGRALRVVARGVYSTTSAPTFTFTNRLGAAASVSASIIGITGAIVAGTTQTSIGWEQEFDVQLTILGGTGANSTVRGFGECTMGLTNITLTGGFITGGAAASATGTVATVDISITNYLNVNGNCGYASASNILQVLQLLVFGLN